jgi:shikimate dehydrogenase
MAPPRIYGLIGYPIKHSLSPQMHNAAFKSLKINAEYKLFEVKPQELGDFLSNLDKNGICGLNVTVPHKEKALDFVTLDAESFYLRKIRAVNTIVKKKNVWKGFNTDIPGFSKHLKENFNPECKRAAVLGAGGAARAVSYVLADSKAKEIAIFDIDKDKTKAVIEMIENFFPGFNILASENVEDLDIKNKDLLVNATPIGLKESDPCLVKEEMLHKNLFVYDLIYNPAETKLLQIAKQKGAKVSNGLGMLLYQGALSFKYFTGKEPPIEIMRLALKTRGG